ncbi:MAG: WD40 repeat domain-containing protein, partial [Verrucomicrobiaceae bacterium]
AALEAARASEERAREELFFSLQNQAQARRNSHRMGQRMESLAVLTQAAHIRASPEVRDNAIAAMTLLDVEHGPVWRSRGGDALAITYDPFNQRSAGFGQDAAIHIHALPDDRELQYLKPDPAFPVGAVIRQMQFSPDGRLLACLDDTGQLGLWRWESGESILRKTPEKCLSLAFSPDSRRLAVWQEGWLSCFDLRTREAVHRWPEPEGIYSMDFHPDNRRLAVGHRGAGTMAVYNTDNGERLASLLTGDNREAVVAWHPDGRLLAVGGSDPRIQIWNVAGMRKVAVLEGHSQQVNFLKFHWEGDMLASMSWDGTMRLWQPSPGRLLMRLPSRWMDHSREGRWAGVLRPENGQAQFWGLVMSAEYHTFLNMFPDSESSLREGDISPDGTLLALGASDGVRLWDVARGREVAWLRMGETTTARFRADGRELLTCSATDGLQRWPLEAVAESGGELRLGPSRRIPLPFAPMRMVRGGDDRTLAVVGEGEGKCVQLDLVTESVRGGTMPHELAGYVALSADATRLATSGWNSDRVKLWDAAGGALIKEWEVASSSLVFFTPDSRELIVARDREFTFHDLRTLEVSRRFPREIGLHPGYIAFTVDGTLMALEMAPGIIHLKETVSGRTVARLEDPQEDISTWMGFTPDGTQLVVAARYAGAVHRWDLRAIRSRLKTMNLDWNWPEFAPPAAETSSSAGPGRRPPPVEVIELKQPASATVAAPLKP